MIGEGEGVTTPLPAQRSPCAPLAGTHPGPGHKGPFLRSLLRIKGEQAAVHPVRPPGFPPAPRFPAADGPPGDSEFYFLF